MATRSEIRSNIEYTRNSISDRVDQISDIFHRRINLQERIRENPYEALAIAVVLGFVVASFPSKFGKGLLRLGAKSATAAAGAYLSKQGMNFIMDRVIKPR